MTEKTRYSLQQFVLQYWPSRSSKVDGSYRIWKSECNLLIVINSNLGPTFTV